MDSLKKRTFKMCLDQGTAAEQQGAELVIEQFKNGILILPPDKIENINEFNIKTYESMLTQAIEILTEELKSIKDED